MGCQEGKVEKKNQKFPKKKKQQSNWIASNYETSASRDLSVLSFIHEDYKVIKVDKIFILNSHNDTYYQSKSEKEDMERYFYQSYRVKVISSKYVVEKRISKRKIHSIKESIMLERNIMAKIKNPFLQSIKSARQDQLFIYLITEFQIGGDLLAHIRRRGVLSEKEAQFYAGEILLGLECLHKNHIIHKDIKTENILISKSGHITITDFGISVLSNKQEDIQAKNQSSYLFEPGQYLNSVNSKQANNKPYILSSERVSNKNLYSEEELAKIIYNFRSIPGTIQYSSPEIILGMKASYAADFWGFGILLFLMMKGYHPFLEMDDPLGTLRNIISGTILQYQDPNPLSYSASTLIDSLLNPNPRLRLGVRGVEEIKNHEFFQNFNWQQCQSMQLTPPFIPSDACIEQKQKLLQYFESDAINTVMPPDPLAESQQKQSLNNTILNFTFDLKTLQNE